MKICALVLAGGRSSRMNKVNKAFLSYKNKTFLQNITDVLNDFDDIYISVDDKNKYLHLNFKLIEDEYKDIGPIGGIYSALKKIEAEFVFVTACDMPKMNKDFVDFLIKEIKEDDMCLVMKDLNNRLYPLGAVYSKKIIPVIEKMIKEKDYKLVHLIENVDGRVIALNDTEFSDEVLMNVNRPDEYQKLINKKV